MNIYQIKQEFINIFDELEENGGELTDELAEKLAITQEEFKEKAKDYANAIKLFKQDIESIKIEQKRLKDFADKKQKIIDRLTNILIASIEEFGDAKPSGVKYIDYGTGEISIRKSISVDVDDTVLHDIERGVNSYILDNKNNRQLDTMDKVNLHELMDYITTSEFAHEDLTPNDILHSSIELNVKIPIGDLIEGYGFNTLKEAAKYTSMFTIKGSAAKSDLKPQLQADGSCAPNLARLVENKTLQIK